MLVRVGSHTARHALERLIQRKPTYCATWAEGGQFARITPEEWVAVQEKKRGGYGRWWSSITKARPKGPVFECWGG